MICDYLLKIYAFFKEGRRDNDNHFPDSVDVMSGKQFWIPNGRDHGSLGLKMTVVTENVVDLTPYKVLFKVC